MTINIIVVVISACAVGVYASERNWAGVFWATAVGLLALSRAVECP